MLPERERRSKPKLPRCEACPASRSERGCKDVSRENIASVTEA
ncbi:MAG: hypothetical protein RL141_263, partial [Candidatus Parcubacteria bacterium]